MVTLVRNDIAAKGSEEWENNWSRETDKLMTWLNEINDVYQFESIWSLWEVRDFTEVPFPGATQLYYSGGWGNAGWTPISAKASWLELWKAADELIKLSEDNHHLFIENFKLNKDGLVEFFCGS